MNGVRREMYGLRQVDTFEKAAGLKPQPVNLPPLKATETWNSPVFQALLTQQQAIETEAELEARQAQLHALMKRVAAEKRLPIEDIKRAVNEIARGAAGGGGAATGGGAAAVDLPARPPGFDPNPDELRQGEGVLEGGAVQALMHHIYASVGNPILPQELKVHQEVASDIGAIGAEHQAMSIETQAQESISAIEKRDEEMRAAQKHRDSIAGMFGRKALEATKGVANSAHAFANYMTTPEEPEEDWMLPSPGLFGVMRDIGGDISSMGSALIEEPQAVREHRERAMPYTAALEAAR
jgi:hypothetical protein